MTLTNSQVIDLKIALQYGLNFENLKLVRFRYNDAGENGKIDTTFFLTKFKDDIGGVRTMEGIREPIEIYDFDYSKHYQTLPDCDKRFVDILKAFN